MANSDLGVVAALTMAALCACGTSTGATNSDDSTTGGQTTQTSSSSGTEAATGTSTDADGGDSTGSGLGEGEACEESSDCGIGFWPSIMEDAPMLCMDGSHCGGLTLPPCMYACVPACAARFQGCADQESCCGGLFCVEGICNWGPEPGCQQISTDCSQCKDCAKQAIYECKSEMDACTADAACADGLACVESCPDQTCADECEAALPEDSRSLLSSILTCLSDKACPDLCP